MLDLSIVIPAFNSSKFIVKCLESIFTDFKNDNFEVIVVNDCSTDNTLQLIEAFASKEKRIRVLSNDKNEKLSKTRQIGMKKAKGLYIMHLDADDWLIKGSVKKILNLINNFNPDILVFNYYRQNSEEYITYPEIKINKLEFTNNKQDIINFFLGGAVTKVVKSELLRNLEISKYQITNSEDFVYCIEILLKSKNILLIPDYFYVYFQNENSITNNLRIYDFFENQYHVIKALNNLIDRYNPDRKIKKMIKLYFYKYIAIAILSDKTAPYKNILSNLKLNNNFGFFNNIEFLIINLSLKFKLVSFLNVLRLGEFKKAIFLTFKNK
jgi:glycosyltransferase involved in cell wall biosynthesis